MRHRRVVAVALAALGVAALLATRPVVADVRPEEDISSFGAAGFHGSPARTALAAPLVDLAATASGRGYWALGADGGVFSFGDAVFRGSTGGLRLNQPIVAMDADPRGRGYWFVASDGGVFSFGVPFFGSAASLALARPVVGMAATPTGNGYWLVAGDGGIFSYGDAHFSGSTGSLRLNGPLVGMAADPDGRGYWLVAADGGVFAFDAPFHGSAAGALHGGETVVGIAAAPDADGYWLLTSAGRVLGRGGVAALGGTEALARRAVAIAAPRTGDDGYWVLTDHVSGPGTSSSTTTSTAGGSSSTSSSVAPATGSRPTVANTGPAVEPSATISPEEAIAAGGASGKVITGDVRIEDWDGALLGRTLTFEDCVIRGSWYVLVDDGGPSTYGLDRYPTINLNRCRIEGSFVSIGALRMNMDRTAVLHGAGMIAPCPDCAGSRYNHEREMPWSVTNSLFTSPPGDPSSGYHYEGAHIAGAGQGYRFTNTRFVQEGPENGTQTGAIFFHGGASTFDGCWFDDGDGGRSNAYHFTIYAYGYGTGARSNVIKNSAIEKGMGDYVYPGGSNDPVIHATYTNNRDLHTGEPLALP